MELKRNGNYWNVKLSKICECNWGKFLSSFGVWLFDKSKWRLVSRSLRRKNRCSQGASRLLVQSLWKCLLNAACTAQCRRGVLHKRNFITFYRHFCFRGLNWNAVTLRAFEVASFTVWNWTLIFQCPQRLSRL